MPKTDAADVEDLVLEDIEDLVLDIEDLDMEDLAYGSRTLSARFPASTTSSLMLRTSRTSSSTSRTSS